MDWPVVSAYQSFRVPNAEDTTKRRGLAGSSSLLACLVSLYTGEILLHVIWGPQNKGDSLVNGLRLHVQHRLGTCGRQAPRLLNDEGHGIALVQEPELQRKVGQVASCPKSQALPRKLDTEFLPLDFCLVSALGSSPSAGGCPRPRASGRLLVHQQLSRAWAFAGTAAEQLPDW